MQIEEVQEAFAVENVPIVGMPVRDQVTDENTEKISFFEHVFENPECGSLPFTIMKVGRIGAPALLDSGSVFNMMRKDVAVAVGAKINEEEGIYMTGSGKGRTIGTANIEARIANRPPRKVSFTVVDRHPFQAIIGYPLLRQKTKLRLTFLPLSEEWTKSGMDLPAEHEKVLEDLRPSIPCRKVGHKFEMGKLVQPLPYQEPQRRLNELKTKYLLEWLPREVTSGLIEEGQLGDYLIFKLKKPSLRSMTTIVPYNDERHVNPLSKTTTRSPKVIPRLILHNGQGFGRRSFSRF